MSELRFSEGLKMNLSGKGGVRDQFSDFSAVSLCTRIASMRLEVAPNFRITTVSVNREKRPLTLEARPRPLVLTLLFVIAAAKILFEPDVKANEQVATAHFFNLQFRNSAPSIPPRNGNHRPSEATGDRLEG